MPLDRVIPSQPVLPKHSGSPGSLNAWKLGLRNGIQFCCSAAAATQGLLKFGVPTPLQAFVQGEFFGSI